MRVTVRANIQKLEAFVVKQPETQDRILDRFKAEGGRETLTYMRAIMPIGKTGQLVESTIVHETSQGFSVYPTVTYAKFVNEDTRPHLIIPRYALALRWEQDPFGIPRFAKKVQHPGTTGQHFIERTRDAMRSVLREILRLIAKEEIGEDMR